MFPRLFPMPLYIAAGGNKRENKRMEHRRVGSAVLLILRQKHA